MYRQSCVAVIEMRNCRGRRQEAARQQVRVTIDDDDELRSHFTRSCVVNDLPHVTPVSVTSSPRNSIGGGESRRQSLMTEMSDNDDAIGERRSSLISMWDSFI